MRAGKVATRRLALFGLLFVSALGCSQLIPQQAAQTDRYPGGEWMQYADVGEAGFDAAKLEAARATWEEMPSSAFLSSRPH